MLPGKRWATVRVQSFRAPGGCLGTVPVSPLEPEPWPPGVAGPVLLSGTISHGVVNMGTEEQVGLAAGGAHFLLLPGPGPPPVAATLLGQRLVLTWTRGRCPGTPAWMSPHGDSLSARSRVRPRPHGHRRWRPAWRGLESRWPGPSELARSPGTARSHPRTVAESPPVASRLLFVFLSAVLSPASVQLDVGC